jgi:hypothetical protein
VWPLAAVVRAGPVLIDVEPLVVTPSVTLRVLELLMVSVTPVCEAITLLFNVIEVGLFTATMNVFAGM